MKRPEGALANKFDDEKLKKAVIAEVKKHNPSAELTTKQINFPFGHVAILQADNKLAVINTEGVGEIEYIADGEAYCKILVAVGLTFGDYLPVKVSELKKALTKETIDLSKAVRSFGDRLDSNHYMWHRRYGSVVK